MYRLKKIFLNLAKINCPSGKEYRIMPGIIKNSFINGFRVSMDENFNIIAIRRNNWNDKYQLPLLCAHMDNISFNDDITHRRIYYNPSNKKIKPFNKFNKNILGGDDKCGIAIIIRLMEEAPQNNLEFIALFTRSEERGIGANKVNKSVIKNSKYAIVIDRRGSSDIVTKIGSRKLCSDKFSNKIAKFAPKSIKPQKINSVHSDAMPLSNFGINNVVNISSGYYNPHSDKEFVLLDDMYNSFKWVKNIIINM